MITTKQLREYLELAPEKEARLDFLRKYVISLWEECTGRRWVTTTAALPVHEFLFCPINELDVESIMLDDVNVRNTVITMWDAQCLEVDADTLVEGVDYRIQIRGRNREGLARIDLIATGSFTTWKANVKILYNAGFNPNEKVPGEITHIGDGLADIQEALLIQAEYHFKRNSDDKLITTIQAIGESRTSYKKSDLHEVFQRAVKKYKIKVL